MKLSDLIYALEAADNSFSSGLNEMPKATNLRALLKLSEETQVGEKDSLNVMMKLRMTSDGMDVRSRTLVVTVLDDIGHTKSVKSYTGTNLRDMGRP